MSSCALAPSNDCDPPVIFVVETPRARKAHHCVECAETIPAGQKYELVRGLWDGCWSTFKTCTVCAEIRARFHPSGIFGDLWSDLAEYVLPDLPAGGPCMEGLSPDARDKLFDARLAMLGLEVGRKHDR